MNALTSDPKRTAAGLRLVRRAALAGVSTTQGEFMRTRKFLARASAAVLVALALLIGGQGTAQASDYGYIYIQDSKSTIAGTLRHKSMPDGNSVIRVCDSRRDGKAVHVAIWEFRGPAVGVVSVTTGYGTCTEKTIKLQKGRLYQFMGYRSSESPHTIFYDEA
ncbi:hypothetical protein ACFVUW_11375 [Streptomyces xiamenensis]|uniref:hypothetical protein n=1 Tax=Streptomyces xiamenensis TaxID=408015 RepID=UPI0036EF4589